VKVLLSIRKEAARLLEDHLARLTPIVPIEALSAAQKKPLIARLTMLLATEYVRYFTQSVLDSCDKLSFAQQAIPHQDAVDRIVRSEAAAERSLARALDRLDQLQRRRKEREAAERSDQLLALKAAQDV